jgi:hypothetical protein
VRVWQLPVIAANAPRRYVSMVGKRGSDALFDLGPSSSTHLAPLPIAPPSASYRDKFNRLMEVLHAPAPSSPALPAADPAKAPATVAMQPLKASSTSDASEPACPYIGFSTKKTDQMLEAQTLWDATMAHSIATAAHSIATAAVSPEAAADGSSGGSGGGGGGKRGGKRPLIVHVCGKFHCNVNLLAIS